MTSQTITADTELELVPYYPEERPSGPSTQKPSPVLTGAGNSDSKCSSSALELGCDEENSPTDQPPEGATVFERPNVSEVKGKLFAANCTLFMGGFSDASLGALVPYLQPAYDIGLLFVALVYLATFSGWFVAGFTNVHLTARVGMGGSLMIGSLLQMFAYCLVFWKPPYPLFVCAFFFCGLGTAYQEAQANVFVASLNNAHHWLGILHSIYGAGALVSPLVATLIASKTPHWNYFYLAALGIAATNFVVLSWTFRNDRQGTSAAKESAGRDLKKALSEKIVLVLAFFFFLYVGAEVTAGGWVVEFLIRVRGGEAAKVGYVASGFWGGLTLGRILLIPVTHRWGERRMVTLYIVLSLVVQLVFWFVPNIITNAVMIGLLGFFLGPLFPTGISVATKLLPRELHVAAIGFTATMGMAGSAAFPFMTGAIATKAGVQVLQPMLIGLLVGMIFLWFLLPRAKRPTA